MDPTEESSGAGAAAGTATPRRAFRAAGLLRRFRSRRVLASMVALSAILWLLWARCGVRGCPAVERLAAYQPGGALVLLDRRGEAFARIAPVERRTVSVESLPKYVPAAFIAVEDRRFFEHRGIDWIRVGGALLANLRAGRAIQGSSTITMQLARNVFADRIPARQRTMRRKMLEARVARRIEKRFTKNEILELYLNHIYFGNGAYGIEAAARHYFGRPAERLTVEQAALLAALPKAPSHYDPRRQPTRARNRRDLVLTLMEREGALGAGAAKRARTQRVRVAAATDARRVGAPKAPYFVQGVREALEERFGEDLWSAPLVVHTTLDAGTQRALAEELEAHIRRVETGAFGRFTGPRLAAFKAGGEAAYLQGAAVAMDPTTGEVRALVGGRDWTHSRFNRAVHARRQVGSAFKPFVFAAALSEGWSAWDWLDDSPYRLASRGGRAWEPNNFDGQFLGPITVREALVMSRNVPTVRLAEAVGVDDVARVARASGLRGDIPKSPVIALGVTEASPLELTSAYAVFANGGESITPRLITRVETRDGKVVWEPGPARRRRVLEGEVAAGITELLRDAVDYGTGRAVRSAGYRGPAAGKTGTTNDGTDAWFVGYTPHLVASVWVGFDRSRPIAARASGGTVAAEIWGRAMRRIDSRGADWPERVEAPRVQPERRPRPGDRWSEEISRQRGRFDRQRAEALQQLADELEDVLEQSEREGAREVRRFLNELTRELERRGDGADWEDVLTEEILRALPRWLSENGREIRFESSRNR